MMPIGDIILAYNLDPRNLESTTGLVDWWIVGTPQMVDSRGGGKSGSLCVRSDLSNAKYNGGPVISLPLFLGMSIEDNLKKTRYYFRPADDETGIEGHSTYPTRPNR